MNDNLYMLEREIGKLQGEMDSVQEDVKCLRRQMTDLLAIVNQARGGWKSILIIAGVAGTMGAIMTKLSIFFGAFLK